MESNKGNTLDISGSAILKISIAIIAFYVLYQIKGILMWFLFALVISILFEPLVSFLTRMKIPRVLSVVFVYVTFFGLLSIIAYITIPMLINEVQEFSRVLPQYFEIIAPPLKQLGFVAFTDIESALGALNGVLRSVAANILNILFLVFGGIFTTIFILTTAIFISLEEKGVEKTLSLFFKKEQEEQVIALWNRCQRKVSSWFLTRVIAGLFVGILSIISLFIFNAPYPVTLGVLAGVLSFVPIIGAFATGVLFFTVISIDSMAKALFAILVYTIIQQLENNILTPIISKKFIDLSPTLVLISMAIGGTLWGFLGAILGVPILGITYEFIKDYLVAKREEG